MPFRDAWQDLKNKFAWFPFPLQCPFQMPGREQEREGVGHGTNRALTMHVFLALPSVTPERPLLRQAVYEMKSLSANGKSGPIDCI